MAVQVGSDQWGHAATESCDAARVCNRKRILAYRRSPGISAAASASLSSFGHSGFTGTYTWIDPEHDLVYVFLSNRVYPTRNNSKISDANIRTGINEVIYQAIKKGN